MKLHIGFLLIIFLFWNSHVSASSAGEIRLDAEGKPVRVYDPAIIPTHIPPSISVKNLPKKIEIDLSEQKLSYYHGNDKAGEFKISSGLSRTPTPLGIFKILEKIPVKAYRGRGYYLPNTKWNLQFLSSGYYIHGAYWHNKFGQPMSHGCINVAYSNMESLYTFSEIGTPVVIHN